MSCSAIISPYYIPLHPPPKTPQRISQENHKKFFFFLFFYIKFKQTVQSSSSSNSTHYLVLNSLTKVSTYSLIFPLIHPHPLIHSHLFFQTPTHTNSTSTSPPHHPYNYDSSLHTPLHFHRYLESSKDKLSFEREMSPIIFSQH